MKIYREPAHKEHETYLPYVALTLYNLGIIDSGKNRVNKTREEQVRKAFEEALNIYKSLAKHDPDQFSPLVERVKKLLKNFPK